MIAHIRTNFKAMHDLYLVVKGCDTPTADEILMASGKKTFNNSLQAEYLKIIEEQASGIKEAFMKQQAKAAVRNVQYLFQGVFMNTPRNLGIKRSSNDF